MNVVGIICEYNPFHNGHALHLRSAREAAGADYAVCVMSGPFVQRGDSAIVDKWTRARAALFHGADLVIELPPQWAARPARDFAHGAVALLAALGVVTHLGFGSELPLHALTEALARGEDGEAVRAALARGESWPRAVAGDALDNPAAAAPNATLGLEYLRALAEFAPDIQPVVINRDAPHGGSALSEICSASAIRAAVSRGDPFEAAMPPRAAQLLLDALCAQDGPATMEGLARMMISRLRSLPKGALDALPGGSEGLGNRLLTQAATAKTIDELYHGVKCKRYTMARIRRLALHAMLGTDPLLLHAPPAYARVLGFRKEAEPLLKLIDQKGRVPLLTKIPKHNIPRSLEHEILAQELWALACPIIQIGGMDYWRPIQILQ